MKALVQRQNGEFYSVNGYVAWEGFTHRGWEIEFFETEETTIRDFDPETVVMGGGETVRRILKRLGLEVPLLDAVPEALKSYAGRKVELTSLGEVRRMIEADQGPLFVKPVPQDGKLFNGQVLTAFRDLIPTSHLEDSLPVIFSTVVNFVSEYRCFILRGEIAGVRHYKGDYRIAPAWDVVDQAVRDWPEAPVACSLDFGVTREGQTLLVEVNDGYSLGAYGLGSITYSRIIEDRWMEMVGLPLN